MMTAPRADYELFDGYASRTRVGAPANLGHIVRYASTDELEEAYNRRSFLTAVGAGAIAAPPGTNRGARSPNFKCREEREGERTPATEAKMKKRSAAPSDHRLAHPCGSRCA